MSSDNSKLFVRASLLLAGLAWTLPFLQPNHYYPILSFYSEWLAFALGLAAAMVLLSREPWQKAALPAVVIAPIGLAAVLGLQAALGRVPYPEQALTAVLYLLWAALLVLLGHALRRLCTLTVVATWLAWFLVAGGVLSALVGLLQYYQLSTPLDFLIGHSVAFQVYGNLGHINNFAAYITLALASAAYLYGCRCLPGVLAAGCVALFLLVLALTGSRSSWLYLGALTALAGLLYARRRDTDSRSLAAVSAGLLPGFIIAQWVLLLPFMTPPEDRLVTSVDRLFQVANGLEPRLQLWGEAWRLFLSAPLLGAGFGQFTWHHFLDLAATGATAAQGIFNHAHNIVLQLLAETGLAGTLIVVCAIALWLADLRRARFDLAGWWLLALLAVIGIHSLLEHPLWYSYFLGIAALALGLGAERAFVLRFSGAARGVTALAIIAGWLNLVAMLPPYREFERLVFLPERGAARPADDAAFATAITDLYREPLLVPYVELAIAYSITVDADQLAEKLALADRAVHFAPVSVVAYRYALLLALAGSREAALAQLERSLRVYPDEAGEVAAQLEILARSRPEIFMPLLELTVAGSARAVNP